MFKKSSLILFAIICSFAGFSQNNTFDYIENQYTDYFKLEPETIYTHINKTKFLPTEELWFKSYIYNTKTQKPYLTTNNVYASLYNSKGQLMSKKIYYAENGMMHGNFSFKEGFEPGIYFLKVSTNWMKNFNEPYYSLQQFEILGNDIDGDESSPKTEQKYDFQLLPEGGHMLTDATNTIGFKGTDINGHEIIITSGEVTDSQGAVVSTFKSNSYGLGKFSLFISKNENYTVKVTLDDGNEIIKPLPKADLKGIALSVNNLNNNTLFISLKTNKNSIAKLLDKPYYIVLHRDGLLKKIDFNFKKDQLEYTIPIPKENLYPGMNILTLFNDKKQPLLERLLFNNTNNLTQSISLLGKNTRADSTQIRLTTNKINNTNSTISISVLPATTEAYNTDNTIISSLLLQPYIKGAIKNPQGYFTDTNRKSLYNLDLLLLTQGWSRYEWQNVFHKPQIDKYNFEAGFQLKGKINNLKSDNIKEIVLFSANNELMLTSPIEDNYFSFDNLSLTENSVISLSAKNKKGKITMPNAYYNIYPTYVYDSIQTEGIIKKPIRITGKKDNLVYDDSFTELDTVLLKVKKYEKKEKFMATGGVNNRSIDLKSFYTFTTRIIDIIRSKGFDVTEYPTTVAIFSRRGTNLQGQLRPQVYLDGMRVSEQLDLIQFLTVEDVEELYIAQTGYGMDGAGGSINIFRKSGGSTNRKPKGKFKNKDQVFGFSLPKTYYAPIYNTSNQDMYAKLAVLNWIPNLSPNADGEFVFNIPNYYNTPINIYIEGLSEDGRLISKIETISLD
ncbi:hypothetical protein ACW5R3_12505 [Bizionia sp. KMM 8389]